MIAYYNMPVSDFVAQLRDIAIKANARPAVIDCIDAMLLIPDEDEIAEAEEAEYDRGFKEGHADGEAEYDRGFKEGHADGEADKENAAEDAAKDMNTACRDAIEALAKDDPNNIGLTEEQINQLSALLWGLT